MQAPILIHYNGHSHPTELPVPNEADDAMAWRVVLEHVYDYIVPYEVSFRLYGRGFEIRFLEGIAHRDDIRVMRTQLFRVGVRATEKMP